MSEGDYLLGTRDDEVARLGLQHRVWRGEMLAGFRAANFGPVQTILDVGAGPGARMLSPVVAEVIAVKL